MTTENTRAELIRLMRIGKAVGGLENAILWIEKNGQVTDIREPSWFTDKVPWLKWYRNLSGCSLKDAVEEGKRRFERV